MEPQDVQRQILHGAKNSMQAAFEAINMLQDQFEKMMTLIIEQQMASQKEGQKVMAEWFESFKKGREDLRKSFDEGLNKAEDLLAQMTP
jgi:hypothetical protein